ncbi:UBC core domain-containing protein [Aphelenchoides besseyi]|nr:UBC core domain-containing protein [Aphelenchoides besseyi]KAI6226083.1 UBC core domain-containing protein [Aphelenchoides besseyi]
MACFQKLRSDLQLLEELFPPTHDRFQIVTASVDELSAKFVNTTGATIRVYANFQENYPQTPPIWFSESEEQIVGKTLGELTDGHTQNGVLFQIYYLVSTLCSYYNFTQPPELQRLTSAPDEVDYRDEYDEGNGSELESTCEDEDVEEDLMCEMEDVEAIRARQAALDEDVAPEGRAVLTRVTNLQREAHMKGSASGSVTASDRLMKELREIYRSENYKNGTFTIELHQDNLYEWTVRLLKVDPDSQLASDMKQMETSSQQNYLQFHFVFKDTFPFEPPFIRLVSPTIMNGFVLGGGALCMELLTKQGWTSAYSIESVIMQIAATLVKGKARIAFDSKNTYSLVKAQQSFKSLVSIHAKSGWYTPNSSEG